MGQRQSKLTDDEIAHLIKETHFDKKELQQWYKGESAPVASAAASRRAYVPDAY
jgi:hypothetical protein